MSIACCDICGSADPCVCRWGEKALKKTKISKVIDKQEQENKEIQQ